MHSLFVCVSALCFFRQFSDAGTTLCQDCRVNVIYPGLKKTHQQLPENQRIVRIINAFRLVRNTELRQPNQDFSFIAKVKVGATIRCSAALVASSLLISSSICLGNGTPQGLQILFAGGKTFAVDSVLKPEFCPELSLLHLMNPSGINPIILCHQNLSLGTNVSMMMASPDLSFYGRRHTQIISNRACKTTFLDEDSVYITPNMLCAKNSMKPEKCATSPGDSLLIDHQLCGLNIYGFRCLANAVNGDLFINLCNLQPVLSDLIRKLNG
ncbi:uncharacterized protein LOC108148596 [Drosophila elegans]|uniref:uncharacterized protein LOC108148596 n=1 Tax=Drosophila elegans TaxID=30023 RepID=UPI0007E87E79|nr:uncharacterized protein LOC108148596 [Drosophila elegans]